MHADRSPFPQIRAFFFYLQNHSTVFLFSKKDRGDHPLASCAPGFMAIKRMVEWRYIEAIIDFWFMSFVDG